jgi:ATP-dependent RNA helicase RhlE
VNPLAPALRRVAARFIVRDFVTHFSDLGLAKPLLLALAAKGYDTPTPIQIQAIPPLLEGRDLCGIAQTGTGKTAAFALPSLDYLLEHPKPRAPKTCRMLVLSPTRELAAQIGQSFRDYGRQMRVSVETAFGGVPIGRQIRALSQGVDVLVATPGRLIDLIEQRAVTLGHVEIFVLDEADQMLDLGFIVPIKRIAKMLPNDRQSLFFSATMPKTIADLGAQFLHDPVHVAVTPNSSTAERVEQYVTFCHPLDKPALLSIHLQKEEIDRALVFTRTKHGADKVVKQLHASNIGCAAIHGNKSQAQRTMALNAFRKGEIRILVATDIAARGIDVSGVSHVFNFDMPNVPEQYVHRIGRTARAGAEGVAISYVAGEEKGWLRQIERLTGVKLTPVPMPANFDEVKAKLPRPAASPPKAQRRFEESGGRDRPRGDRPENEQQRRAFRHRRPAGVGTHKAAVRKTGAR